MIEFSQMLEKCIYKSGLTENQLAKISGFTRSYIALMKNGQRLSKDIVRMQKLLGALGLSPHEYDELWNMYLFERDGKQVFKLRESMISLIESFGRISKISIKTNHVYHIPDVKIIDNRIDTEILIKAIIEQEATKDQGRIQMILQDGFEFLFNLLPSVRSYNDKIKIEHIVCLDENGGSDFNAQIYNLTLLEKLLPTILSGENEGYEVYYYYDKVASRFSNMAILPYIILTSDYVMPISTNIESALIFNERDVCKLYRRFFQEQKRVCRCMLERLPADLSLYAHCNYHFDVEELYTIGAQPCFGVFPVDEMITKYIPEEKKDWLHIMKDTTARSRQMYQSLRTMTSYFTKKGIVKLLETGIIDELPHEVPVIIEHGDRKKLLGMLIQSIRRKEIKAYLLDEQKILFPVELIIHAYSFTEVNFIYMSERKETCFILKEQSLSRSVYSFLTDLKESTYVLGIEETLEYLEKIYSSFK